MNRRWPILLLVAMLPMVAQEEEAEEESRGPYFAVSTSRSFGPGETPVVQLWAQGVDRLQFRVYRVNDPAAFYATLREEVRSGGRRTRPPARLTPIEKLYRWKRSTRAAIREVFRAQYSAESRASIRARLEGSPPAREPKPAAPATSRFAGVPILNPQQLVSTWDQPVAAGRRWDARAIPVPVERKGLYLVEVTDGKLQAYTIVSVSEIALMTKGAPGRVYARVVDRASGAPAPGVALTVRLAGKPIGEARTNAAGMAEIAIAEPRPEQALVMARRDDDFAALNLYGYGLRASGEGSWTAYIYTDRPVYRPGHKVHFRGILRIPGESDYEIPAGRDVDLEVQDPDGNAIVRRKLTVSAMGTIKGEFDIPSTAALGYYYLQARSGETYMSGGFHVEEYRKPEYEVRVALEQRRVIQGEAAAATIEARYYYGEPVAGGKVAWVVHRTRHWMSEYMEDEAPEEGEGEYYAGEQVHEAQGVLNADGRLAIRVPTSAGAYDYRYRLEARVTDAGGREIAGAGTLIATQGSYHVHIRPDRYVYSPKQQARFEVEARDYEGNPVAGAVMRVSLAEYNWNVYGSGQEKLLPGETETRTDAEGKAAVAVTLPGAGSYRAYVRSRTPEGRDVTGSTYLWISGTWGSTGSGRQRVTIVPDKKSYRPGDVAKVLIVPGVEDAHLWVTTEANAVYTSRTLAVKGGSATVEIPIAAGLAPNFFVVASFLRNGQLYHGVKSVKVPPVEKQLQVTVTSSKAEYKPGEEGVFTVEARDHAGRPASAEFSIGVVDEAIYAIRREPAEDIVRAFYGRRHNRISLDTSLSMYFHGEAGKRRMQLAQVRPLKARAQLKPERLVEPRVRKAFPDTIYWVADVTTDARGRARARVAFPDSLTSWRATARGVTRDTKVGGAIHRATVRKNLMVSLGAPRFVREGDTVLAPAIVRNYLPDPKTARVTLDAQGAALVEGGATEITVPSRGQAVVDYRLRPFPGAEVVLTVKALTNEESDAMEIRLPVRPFGVEVSSAQSGALGDARTEAEASFTFPGDATPGTRQVEIAVTPSVAGAIFGALEYLTTFPYGCTEQTMSSFLPNVIVSRAARELGLRATIDQAALDQKIRQGLERLYDFQHEDGGWGWWKTDDSDRFLTAYVLSGLRSAREAGVQVRTQAIDEASKWLIAELPKIARDNADLKAYAVWALGDALKGKAAVEDLYRDRASLTPYALVMTGLALDQLGDARAGEIASMVEVRATVNDREAYWKTVYDHLLDIDAETTSEVTAHALKLIARRRPESPLAAKAAQYLVSRRDQGNRWSSTKQTAMVVYGLTDYVRKSGELKPDLQVTVTVNDREVLSRRLAGEDALGAPLVVRVGPGEMPRPEQRVRVRMKGSGRVYWTARSSYWSPTRRLGDASGLAVQRDYFRLAPRREGDRIVHDLEPLAGPAERGDVLAVRLTLEGKPWRYLMIEDPIPAGAEPIERDDLYDLSDKPEDWQAYWVRRELRDDRAAFFQTFLGRGRARYFYLLKVTNSGQFRVSPTTVQPMYQPHSAVSGESRTLEVR
jgi:uncharacterized protein YfaS (alpha-2-macroglobulin family)